MELTQLKQFKVVAECENLSEASSLLYVTQPALSRAMHKLEDELGVALFDRMGKKIRLNPSGQLVLEYVDNLFQSLEEMQQKLVRIQEQAALSVCSPIMNFMQYVVPQFCVEHPASVIYPQIKEQETLYNLLQKDVFDLVLSAEPFFDEIFENIPLCCDWAGISVPEDDPLAQKPYVSLKDLKNRTFISFIHPNPLTILSKKFLEKAENINYLYQSDLTSISLFAEKTAFISLLSSFSIQFTRLGANRIFVPFDKHDNIVMTYYAIYKKDNRMKAKIKYFISWLQHYLEEYNQKYPLQKSPDLSPHGSKPSA